MWVVVAPDKWLKEEFDFTVSVCAVVVGKDRQEIVWAWEAFVNQIHP